MAAEYLTVLLLANLGVVSSVNLFRKCLYMSVCVHVAHVRGFWPMYIIWSCLVMFCLLMLHWLVEEMAAPVNDTS
jgi:hypothetical protein